MLSATQFALATCALAAVVAVAVTVRLRPSLRLGRRLPGPPGRLVVGNLADLPHPGEREWVVYGALCDKYGPIIRLDVLGQTIIVLDSPEDVKQLFWTRNNNYSNRISMAMVELTGWGNATGIQQPGDDFRARRRLMNKMLGTGPGGARSVVDVQERAVRYLVRRVASGQVGLTEGIKHMSGYIIVQTAYGYTPREKDDYFVEISEKGLAFFLEAHNPGWLVNIIPIARFIPSWFPGAGWKHTVREWREIVETVDNVPFAWARQQIDAGTAAPSFTRKFLTDPEFAVEPELLRNTLSSLYAAGADTTTAVSHCVFLTLALHPAVQARAQAEIDAVTQSERLPVISDRSRLPYVEAVLKEVYRWQSLANLALPHVALNDDEYKGYHIPSGAIIIANVWRILHNPHKYPEPGRFHPERFMQRDDGAGAGDSRAMNPNMVNEDPWQYIFGFGLRQCPGRHMADATIWLLLTHVLATVNVREPVRADGTRITLENIQPPSPGFVGRTDMTSCTVEFRSAKTEALLAAEEAASH